jgi:hypothetical protein
VPKGVDKKWLKGIKLTVRRLRENVVRLAPVRLARRPQHSGEPAQLHSV